MQFSTSTQILASGRFRKMKQATPNFLARTQVKEVTEKTSTVFDPDYLDTMVEKILKGNSRSRLNFLMKQPSKPLEEEVNEARENVVKDWNHIHETVIDLGVPEMADVIGGQMFAGSHLNTTTTSCLTLRLADNLSLMTDREMKHLLQAISNWPADAGGSETLMKVVDKLDAECARRCDCWELEDCVRFALIWVRYSFRPEQCKFTTKVLERASSKIHEFRLSELLSYMLLLSYLSHWAPNIASKLDEAILREVETRLNKDFFNLNQTEVAVVYSALNTLSHHGPEQLRQKIQNTYGFRL